MILLFPQRLMLPSFRPASLQLIPSRYSQTEVLRASLSSSAYYTRPVLILTTPSAPHILRLSSPTSLHCLVQTCYSRTRSLLNRATTWCFSLHPPRAILCQGRSPRSSAREEHKVLPLRKGLPRHLHMQVSSRKSALQTKPWRSWQASWTALGVLSAGQRR